MALVEESCILSARPDPDDETPVKGEFDLGQVSHSLGQHASRNHGSSDRFTVRYGSRAS